MLLYHQPRLHILGISLHEHMHPGLHYTNCYKNLAHPAQYRVAVLGLQGLHHARLCSSSLGVSSRIRAHWARPMQRNDADALDDSADNFDEDAPLLSGVQLTEGLQHEARTAADVHSQNCTEAAQVPSILQYVPDSI